MHTLHNDVVVVSRLPAVLAGALRDLRKKHVTSESQNMRGSVKN